MKINTPFYLKENFLNNFIYNQNKCIICWTKLNQDNSNHEHIIPNWIIKKFKLQDKTISLTNNKEILYPKYKIQCCRWCNSELWDIYEKPLQKLFNKEYKDFIKELTPKNIFLIFRRLSLIFIKTYIKDREILQHEDRRLQTWFISNTHYRDELMCIFNIARSSHSKIKISKESFWTIYFLECIEDSFNYIDDKLGVCVLKLWKICVFCVLNDAGMCKKRANQRIKKITWTISPIQVIEIHSQLCYLNYNLKERPNFFYRKDDNENYLEVYKNKIQVIDEELQTIKPWPILKRYVEDFLDEDWLLWKYTKEEVIKHLDNSTFSWLFDENGQFMQSVLVNKKPSD